MLVAWEIATRILTTDQIEAAAMHCIQNIDSDFMPTTGQFIRMAKRIEGERIANERINREIQESSRYLTENPVGKEKIKELSGNLAQSMTEKKVGSLEKSSIALYEFLSESGKTIRFEAIGKHEFQFFMDQVYKSYGKILHKVIHQHVNWELMRPPEHTKGKPYHGYRKLHQHQPGSEVLTVGYV